MSTKVCGKCKEEKDCSKFHTRSGVKNLILRSDCKSCVLKRNNTWNANNRERNRQTTRESKWKSLGMDVEEARRLRESVKNCAICNSSHNLYIDHCHETRKVRGVLCRECNAAIGLLKDNAQLMRNAAEYIDSN